MKHVVEIDLLVVDDDPDDQILFLEAIREVRPDLDVQVLDSAQEALEFLEEHYPRLIVTDLKMPGVDGADFLRMLRRNPDLRSSPTVVLSTSSSTPDVQRAWAAGCCAYHVKPDGYEELLELVTELTRYWLGGAVRSA